MIMPSYFAAGYFSWSVASVLIGRRGNGISGSDLWLLPIVSSFVMVMWDLSLDPLCATISGEWVWEDGGPYFGVPLTNFLGWYLCIFTFYLVFALYLRATRSDAAATAITAPAYWVLAILAYASMSLQVWGSWLLRPSTEVTDQAGHVWQTGDIYSSMVLVNLFTMIFVCFLGLVLVGRDSSREAAG
jgi:putative membrane protein